MATCPQLLNYSQARKLLGIDNKQTFYNLVSKGIFREAKVQIPGMKPKFRADVLQRLIEQNTLKKVEV